MRMHRLEIEGFGPFRRPQTVDFDAFAEDGIFVISGRTGAGKSSILDAICFALYGSVPRYDTGEKRLRSDHSGPDDPTLVALEFSAGGERWRVERRFEEYEHALEQRRKESEARVAGDGDTLAHRLDDAERLIADHDLGGEDAGGGAPTNATPQRDNPSWRIDAVRQAAERAAYRAETAALAQDVARVARDSWILGIREWVRVRVE